MTTRRSHPLIVRRVAEPAREAGRFLAQAYDSLLASAPQPRTSSATPLPPGSEPPLSASPERAAACSPTSSDSIPPGGRQ
jgi:hypothetical protein